MQFTESQHLNKGDMYHNTKRCILCTLARFSHAGSHIYKHRRDILDSAYRCIGMYICTYARVYTYMLLCTYVRMYIVTYVCMFDYVTLGNTDP